MNVNANLGGKYELVKKFFSYCFLFYIIYTPSFSNSLLFDKNITLPIITLLFLFHHCLLRNNVKILSKTSSFFCLLITLANIYSLLVYMTSNQQLSFIDSRIVQGNIAICYIVIISVFCRYARYRLHICSPFNMVVNLAALQGIIGIAMLLSGALHEIALSLYGVDNAFITSVRIFGISSDYTYATPIYHGIIGALLLSRMFSEKMTARLFLFNLMRLALIVIIILLNGRTGLVVFAMCSLLLMIHHVLKSGRIFKLIRYSVFAVVVFSALMSVIRIVSPNNYRFITSFFDDTYNTVFLNQDSGNYAILNNSISLPHGIELLIGEGKRVYGKEAREAGYVSSDIGFVNDIYRGGLIYAILLYGSYLYLIFSKIKDNGKRLSLILALTLANYKGEAFHASIIIFGIIFICITEEFKRGDNNVQAID